MRGVQHDLADGQQIEGTLRAHQVPLPATRANDDHRQALEGWRMRVVNVVDLMRLLPDYDHPRGLPDSEFDTLFTEDRPVIFAFHGYPWLVHRLTYRRRNHAQLHVRGYKEQGTARRRSIWSCSTTSTATTSSWMSSTGSRASGLGGRAAGLRQKMAASRLRARTWTRRHGEDAPEVGQFTWPG